MFDVCMEVGWFLPCPCCSSRMSQKLGIPFRKGMRWHDWHRSRVQQQTRCWCKRCSADFKRAACSAASWNRWNHLNHGATGGALETTPSWIPNHDKHIVPKTAGFSQFFWTFVCLRLSKNVFPTRSKPEWKISPGSHVGSPWFSLYADCVASLNFVTTKPGSPDPKHCTFRQWSASFLKSSYQSHQSSERSTSMMPILHMLFHETLRTFQVSHDITCLKWYCQ